MKFIIATHNLKKLEELKRILTPLGIEAVTDKDLNIVLDEVEENGTTFKENAALKARSACRQTGLPAIGDDSGLVVDALHGAPGVFSARYAGENATDEQRIEKILNQMKDVPKEKRTAHFVSNVCCVFPNGKEFSVEGICWGSIAIQPSGTGGFGYDPIFLTDGKNTFADLTAEEKDKISHRGKALRAFSEELPKWLNESKIDLEKIYDK